MENVFEVVVVLRNVLRDDIGRSARCDHHGLQASAPRLKRKNHLADVARDHGIDVILVHGALESADQLGGGRVIVVGDEFDLLAIHAACGVDLIGGKLRSLRDR